MNGIIKKYNNDKGYGFISGDNGDVFFHISNLQDKGTILSIGMGVTYLQGTNEKGEYAYDIKVTEAIKPIFLKLGSDRIKLSNIKNYGIANGSDEIIKRLQEYEDTLEELEDNIKNGLFSDDAETRHDIRDLKTAISELKNSEIYQFAKKGNAQYLFITTYQGDNYKYYECECNWNIYEKLEQLDNYMCK